MINGVVFKIKPYEDEGIQVWLVPIFGMNQIGQDAIPLCGKENQFSDLEYQDLQFVNYHVKEIRENGSVGIDMTSLIRCRVEEKGDTPIYVYYKNGEFDFLINDVLEDIREGSYEPPNERQSF
jgi:hypothetical protein